MIYASIEELKNAINDSIYANDAGLITAEILQERIHDVIDTINAIGASVNHNHDDRYYTQSEINSSLSAKADLVGGVIPSSQLPSYVDDVLEYANFAALPASGETGKIYITINDNLTYRWSGSAYVEVSKSLALGETSSTAYRGDRGKTAYDHSQNNNQAHSDYLKNDADDITTGSLTIMGKLLVYGS